MIVVFHFKGYVKVTVMVLGPGDEAPVSYLHYLLINGCTVDLIFNMTRRLTKSD